MRRYLAEFLSDPMVVRLPRFIWLPILHGIVLRTRPAKSAEKYQQIWTPEGSPLAVHTARQAKLLGARYAMRYGGPDVREVKASMPEDTVVVPLYPQYSDSTTGSVISLLGHRERVVRGFHDHPSYIKALAALVSPRRRSDFLVMSFHGLPRRGASEYERQCLETARLFAKELNLPEKDYCVTFQSRFGWAKWLQPYTQPTLVELARGGRREIDVVCPGFVSDCLETLEEIGITARKAFVEAGGRELNLIPCLNESPEWIEALRLIASRGP